MPSPPDKSKSPDALDAENSAHDFLNTILPPSFTPGGLADTLPIAVIAMDLKLNVVGWNRAAEDIFGWTSSDMLGSDSWRRIVPDEFQDGCEQIFIKLASEGREIKNVNANITRDHHRIVCEWHNSILKTADGVAIAYLAMARDITLQHQIDQQRIKFQEIVVSANAAQDASEILRLIRNATIEVGGFDRAGVWLYENERFRGSWGTDIHGQIRNESEYRGDPSKFAPELLEIIRGERSYAIASAPLMFVDDIDDTSATENKTFAVMGLYARGFLIAALFCDNAVSKNTITDEQIQTLMPFCEQVAVALSNAKLMEERGHMIERQHRLMEISTAINQSLELEEVLHMVRNAIVSAGGFERAGVFRVEHDTIIGSWGTDTSGNARDERDFKVPISGINPLIRSLVSSGERYVLENAPIVEDDAVPAPVPRYTIRRAVIALRASGEFIGLISVDNLLSGIPATPEAVEALLPFCEQAAVAIRNASLLSEREGMIERQRRLSTIAAAINTESGLHEILRLVRDALVEVAGFDRAGLWLYDRDNNVLKGTWGTDRVGKAHDISDDIQVVRTDDERQRLLTSPGEVPYQLTQDYTAQWGITPDNTMYGVRSHATVALRAGSRVLGLLCVDNFLSGTQITESDVEALLPFTEQAAVAISNATLVEAREKTLNRQMRLMDISAAINRSVELDELLLLVRNAIIDSKLFDRVGVWTLAHGYNQGSWGTDRHGNLRDERDVRETQESWGAPFARLMSGENKFYVEDWTPIYQEEGISSAPIPHAVIALRTSGEMVGLVSVDNLITRRPIVERDVQALIPFAEQAAVAIRNAQLQKDRERLIERQRRLASLSAAIVARTELNEILHMVRDAIVEVVGVDRAGIFLLNKQRQRVEGTWGTDRQGMIEDLSHLTYPIDRASIFPMWKVVRGDYDYIVTENITEAYNLPPEHPLHGVKGHLAVTMKAGGEIVGVIGADNLLTDRAIGEDDVALLLPFAEQAAVAIQNVRLWEERQAVLDQQQRLATISVAINSRTDLQHILMMVRDAAVETAGFDRAGLFFYDSENNVLRGVCGTDRNGNSVDISNDVYKIGNEGQKLVALLLASNASHLISEDFTRDQGLAEDDGSYGVRHLALLKLISDGEVLGILSVDNLMTDRPIKDEDVEALLPFANQAAVAIQNSRLFNQLKQTQEALVRAERLRALGELAGGVAHNINNLLTAVLGYSELIQQEPDVTASIAHYARIIERAGLDGAEIVRRVRQFAQNEAAASMEPFNLAKTVRQALDLTRPLWRSQMNMQGSNVEIIADIPEELTTVGVATEIREVVVNLIKNALESMPDGGTLTINCREEDNEAIVKVSDTGIGMDEATRRRVFEPFFTTKGVGIGTGLGLSLVWGIIRRHNGTIEVESVPGNGSCFRIQLPVAPPQAKAEEISAPAKPLMLNGTRVLLVEDEEVVAESVARMLISRGATVALAESGEEALEWLEAHSEICNIVLSDHGMPGMSGLEMLALVREKYPKLKRILLSGWGASPPGATDTSAADRILSKPIRQNDLLSALHAAAASIEE